MPRPGIAEVYGVEEGREEGAGSVLVGHSKRRQTFFAVEDTNVDRRRTKFSGRFCNDDIVESCAASSSSSTWAAEART